MQKLTCYLPSYIDEPHEIAGVFFAAVATALLGLLVFGVPALQDPDSLKLILGLLVVGGMVYSYGKFKRLRATLTGVEIESE